MAKKTTGYDREVTEDRGVYTWRVHDLTFRLAERFLRWSGMRGINLSVEIGGQEYAFAKDLKEAGVFSEGFVAGMHAQIKGRCEDSGSGSAEPSSGLPG